jgi:hypothetical protein
VLGNGHAPFWNSGRWSDPPLDCNKLSEGYLLSEGASLGRLGHGSERMGYKLTIPGEVLYIKAARRGLLAT